jgi:DNA repair protein RecO (recombination protein O)
MLAKGRNLDIITQSQTVDGFLGLKSDLWRISCSFYVSELIDAFTIEGYPNQPLFDLLLSTLRYLCQTDSETVLRYFELHLLDNLGYRPQLYNCVSCNLPLKPGDTFFSSSQGGVLCSRCNQGEFMSHPVSIDALKVLRLWQDCDYATASRVKVTSELSSELRQLMQEYITHLLQKEVKSMAWLGKLRKESGVDSGCRVN